MSRSPPSRQPPPFGSCSLPIISIVPTNIAPTYARLKLSRNGFDCRSLGAKSSATSLVSTYPPKPASPRTATENPPRANLPSSFRKSSTINQETKIPISPVDPAGPQLTGLVVSSARLRIPVLHHRAHSKHPCAVNGHIYFLLPTYLPYLAQGISACVTAPPPVLTLMVLGAAAPRRRPVGAVSADTMSSNDKEWVRACLSLSLSVLRASSTLHIDGASFMLSIPHFPLPPNIPSAHPVSLVQRSWRIGTVGTLPCRLSRPPDPQ